MSGLEVIRKWSSDRLRWYRIFRRAYGMGRFASAWRSFRNWFVWDLIDPIRFRKTRRVYYQATKKPNE